MLLTFLFSLSVALTNVFPNSAPQNTNILASSKSAFDAQLSSGANISSCAEVTVFTHGMGGSYADWLASGDGWIKNEGFFPFEISHENVFVLDASNTAATYNPGAFFDAGSLSIVPLVFNEAGTHFRKASISTYPVDFSKQIILVYSGINDVNQATTNEAVYFHFEHSIDTFLYSLSNEIGIVPKINLIGHSRGGITNLLYAMDHPQIVNNLISVGTPYGGSKLLKLINTYLGAPLQETLVPYQPLLNETSFNGYADRWNALGEKPSAKFIGVYQQYDYLIDNILYYVGNDSFFFDVFSAIEGVVAKANENFSGFFNKIVQTLNLGVQSTAVSLSQIANDLCDLIPFHLGDGLKVMLNAFFVDLFDYVFSNFIDDYTVFNSDVLVERSSQLGCPPNQRQMEAEVAVVEFASFDGNAPMARPGLPVAHNFETKSPLVWAKISQELGPASLHSHSFTLGQDQNSHFLSCSCGAKALNATHQLTFVETASGKDRVSCFCGYSDLRDHSYVCSSYDSSGHVFTCSYCGDSVTSNHSFKYADCDSSRHHADCSCGYECFEDHYWDPRNRYCVRCRRQKNSSGGIIQL